MSGLILGVDRSGQRFGGGEMDATEFFGFARLCAKARPGKVNYLRAGEYRYASAMRARTPGELPRQQ